MMAREKIQALALPGPVFHDLRRQLHEIPSDVHAIERLDFNFAEEVVEEMAELVENGFDLAVRQERRTAVRRWRHVPANEPQMRSSGSIRPRTARDEIVHPCAATLRFARMPVGVKRSEVPAFAIEQIVELHLGMPHLDVLAHVALNNAQTEYATHQLK